MKSIKMMALTAALLLIGFNAHAIKYGTAGCGLGAVIIKDKPGKIQIVAALLNNWVVPQTSAITSGTMGCVESRRDRAALFIEVNHVALQTEMARGEGETLNSLANIYGCSNTAQFSKTLKRNFKKVYSTKSDKGITSNIEGVIQNNNNLSNSCSIFG